MIVGVTRRGVLGIGCLLATGLRPALAGPAIEISMKGTQDGGRVWFEPVGIHVAPGTIIRWTNRDSGNSHSTTAYHPANDGHPLRIPSGAKPWNSGLLLPGQQFELLLSVEGVYDYYCQPHEMAGMAGRIIVGTPSATGFWTVPAPDIPAPVMSTLPTVDLIMQKQRVDRPAPG